LVAAEELEDFCDLLDSCVFFLVAAAAVDVNGFILAPPALVELATGMVLLLLLLLLLLFDVSDFFCDAEAAAAAAAPVFVLEEDLRRRLVGVVVVLLLVASLVAPCLGMDAEVVLLDLLRVAFVFSGDFGTKQYPTAISSFVILSGSFSTGAFEISREPSG